MDKNKLKYYQNHTVEQTRRQFLKSTLGTFAAAYFGPSLLSLNPQMIARAQSSQLLTQPFPYISIEAAGGMMISGNVLVGRDNSGTQDGSFGALDTYKLCGLSEKLHPSLSGMIDSSCGLKFHSSSGLVRGIKEVLNGKTVLINGVSKNIIDMIDGVLFCHTSSSDNNKNLLNSSMHASKLSQGGYGNIGALYPLVGQSIRHGSGGGAYMVDNYDPSLSPALVRNFKDCNSLVDLGTAKNKMGLTSNSLASNFLSLIGNTVSARIGKYNNSLAVKEAQELGKKFESSSVLFENYQSLLNPLGNATEAQLLSSSFTDPAIRESAGAISYLVSKNLVGSGTIMIEGYDYHDGTVSTGLEKDIKAGHYIGSMILYFARKGQSLVLDICSDGACIADSSGLKQSKQTGSMNSMDTEKIVLVSDSDFLSSSFMITYHHGKTRSEHKKVVTGSNNTSLRQVGHFVPNSLTGIAMTNSISTSLSNLWKIKMMNYLSIMVPHDDTNLSPVVTAYENFFGRGTLPADYKDLVRFRYLGV